jgi:putative membrane protein insertion efficiency factor
MRRVLSLLFIAIIKVYQYTISPLFGPVCRFEPSCSHYAIDAVTKYGPLKGSVMAVRRILRCHPLNDGGYDPVK